MPLKKKFRKGRHHFKGYQSPLPKDDFGHLDVRVGQIEEVFRHPRAGFKYLALAVDMGGFFNQIMSANLTYQYEEEELIGKMVVCICNIRPVWMRQQDCTTSIICGKTTDWPEKVELIQPPQGAVPGDIIVVQDHPRDCDTPFMNPENKIYEEIVKHIRIDPYHRAVYKSKPWILQRAPPDDPMEVDNVAHCDFVKSSFVKLV